MSTNDEREALRSDSVAAAAKRHEAAEARWKEVVSVGLCEDDEPTKQAFTVGYVLALASLPAPTPAATCGDEGRSLCPACSLPAHELTQVPGCGAPMPRSPFAITAEQLGEIMQEEWGEICEDAQAHPQDIRHEGRKLFYDPRHWTAAIADRLNARTAPTPAAGEAVAYLYRNEDGLASVAEVVSFVRWTADNRVGWDETRLYAAPPTVGQQVADLIDHFSEPQPPAPGGELVERIIAVLKAEQDRLDGEDYLMDTNDCIDVIREKFAALANHSPDAGGVGEAWVCDGIPDEVIEAGISAWDAAKHDMENYVSGVTTDWDEGMIVAAIYKAMSAALNPADAEGGE